MDDAFQGALVVVVACQEDDVEVAFPDDDGGGVGGLDDGVDAVAVDHVPA